VTLARDEVRRQIPVMVVKALLQRPLA